MRTDVKTIPLLIVLSVSQLIAWGTISLPAVLGDRFAHDLNISLTAAFAGTTTMLVLTGLTTPFLAGSFIKYGARPVMAVGSLLSAPGFLLIAAAQGPVLYYAGWVVLGVAGAAMLSTPTYILLNEVAGAGAKRLIGALMLVTGLSSSLFWPITAALSDWMGWRATVSFYGVLAIGVCFPLHVFALPARRPVVTPTPTGTAASSDSGTPTSARGPYILLMAAICLCAFVTWGFVSIVIQLLKSLGVDEAMAIRIGALLGVVQMLARVLDFVGGARWDGLTTGLASAFGIPFGLLALIVGGGASWSIWVFLAVYGLASGAMAVARATMPLVFYDQVAFARISSHIALPLNIAVAIAPPILVSVLTSYGPNAAIGLTLALALVALALLLALAAERRKLGRV
ncbi:MAG: MFS transporter [Xanthobacteraceae bacterium]